MRELNDDDALWIGQGVPLMDSRNAETIALVRAGYRAAQAMTEGPAADPIADLCERLRALHIIDEVGSDNPLGRDAADALERLARERDEARDGWRMANGVADLAMKHRDSAEAERERLARERDDIREMLQNTNRDAARLANIAYKYKWQVRDTCTRAERAEAERDEQHAMAVERWDRMVAADERAERAEAERDEAIRQSGLWESRAADWKREFTRADRAEAERDTLRAIVRAADAMHLKPTMDNINAWAEARAKWEDK